ncbi:hypothetical protein BCR33DRAFT_726266 [Rhizoclosmatium globosum]|uniref:Zn(2)-C6 fungal-type domain-containing protein n=1 Tax=Rhizoclosmatium globosum TaxID=329046 RepID=A0A1Y2AV04_9FUNG|nr:hypothetical protein BCR33DRAFT_726266 [Rhizoclosmatium globosum]|eukprot:ORY26401.1 hypothetical protein BCR33DRAFT_726266 [Rhizoclosmatium globosum]
MHGLHVSQATSAADIEKPQNSCDQCRLRKKKCVLQPPHERHCTRCSRLGIECKFDMPDKRKRRAFERQPVVSRVGVMQGVSQWVVSASNQQLSKQTIAQSSSSLSQNGFCVSAISKPQTTPAFPRRNLGPGGEDLGIVSEPPLLQEPISSNVLPPPWNSIRYSYPLESRYNSPSYASSNSSTSSFRQVGRSYSLPSFDKLHLPHHRLSDDQYVAIARRNGWWEGQTTKYPTPVTPTHRNVSNSHTRQAEEAYEYSDWTTGPKAQSPILQRLINHVPPAHSPVSQFILTGNELPLISGMLGTGVNVTSTSEESIYTQPSNQTHEGSLKTSESHISTNRLPGGGISLMDLMN